MPHPGRGRFYSGPWKGARLSLDPGDLLREVLHALGEGFEQQRAERGLALYECEKIVPSDRDERAVGLGNGARCTRCTIDERHFAEDATWADPFDHALA